MGWYILHCRLGMEREILNSCRRHLSREALEQAFIFQSQRLWHVRGAWKLIEKELFPGYVFLQSSQWKQLSEELQEYRDIVKVLEEPGYLISVYEEEEAYLRKLCGEHHVLSMSYGYKDRNSGVSYIVKGPLKGMQENIKKIDWHKRLARLEAPLFHKKVTIWAGIGIICE